MAGFLYCAHFCFQELFPRTLHLQEHTYLTRAANMFAQPATAHLCLLGAGGGGAGVLAAAPQHTRYIGLSPGRLVTGIMLKKPFTTPCYKIYLCLF